MKAQQIPLKTNATQLQSKESRHGV